MQNENRRGLRGPADFAVMSFVLESYYAFLYPVSNYSEHIADEGWYPSPAPTPSAATAGNGWKEYGSRNTSGVIMDVSSRYHGSRQLSLEEYGQLQEKLETEFSFYRL